MKKIFSMVLVLCMLMGMASFAEHSIVLQNEQPPKVVSYVNANGDVIVAKICDAEGNVLAEIKDDGTLVLTDAHQRDDVENEVIAKRLTAAYEGVMEDVHHADVECKLHDHDVKVDIDAVLAAINHEMDSHDLVMHELFDVMLSDEAAALLTEGAYIEITFEVEMHELMPLITMFTNDGSEWLVLPIIVEGESRFTLQLPKCGSVALLVDGHQTMGIGEEVQRIETVVPGEEGGEEPFDSDNFTPSVSGKDAPEIVTFEGTDGETYVAYIYNKMGDEKIGVPDRNYIVITAVSERDYVIDIQTHEHLEWSYDRILEAEDVGDLFTEHDLSLIIPDHEHGTIAGLLDETLTKMGVDATHDQLVVKDLFEVSAYGDYLHLLYDEDYYLELTLKTDFDPDMPVIVLHSPDSKHWHVHPIEEFAVNENGEITLNMYDLGAVALLVLAEDDLNPETAVQSPN